MYSDELRGLLQKLNQYANTHVTSHDREVSVWTNDNSSLTYVADQIKKFFAAQSALCEETVLTTKAMEEHLQKFFKLGIQVSVVIFIS